MAGKKTDNPRTNFVTLRLTDSEAQALDALVSSTGQTRSQIMRAALSKRLGAASPKAAVKAGKRAR